ncbi:MAG: lipid II flippase MurJ [Bacteroidota bacterium]
MKNRQLHHALSFWKNYSKKSINRQILSTTVIITCMTIVVKIVSVSKEFVVAWSFGTSDAVDALVIALLLPMFITSVAAHSFRQAFIPVYIRVREQEGKQYAQRLLSGSLPYVVGILSLITILMVLFAHLYLPKIATGFSPNKRRNS